MNLHWDMCRLLVLFTFVGCQMEESKQDGSVRGVSRYEGIAIKVRALVCWVSLGNASLARPIEAADPKASPCAVLCCAVL